MLIERGDELLALQRPELDGLVVRAGGQQLRVGRDVETANAGGVRLERRRFASPLSSSRLSQN